MKKYISLIAILLLSTAGLFAQSIYDIRNAIDFFESNKMQRGEYRNTLTEDDIDGSPFLDDEFINGTVYTYQKIQFNDIPLRYNIFNDEMEFQTPDNKILAIAAPEIVEKAVVGENIISNIPYKIGNKIKRGYFILLTEGNVNLYARPEVRYQKPKEAAPYKDPEPAKFVERPHSYYLRLNEEAAVKVESKKDLRNFFSDHQNQVEDFIKENKVKPGKEDKLIELVKYYNSL
ncbi:BlaI/MecI/CopY family transcriptional regulator [Draconibacterium halophilum]|uniref:BlaI/MecI/CopY family transcriptional regulator n=1 Tax=Draconibacterium halophilum TaxID=2706887 RepID=A0A6C0RDC1_9BACT|nr:BlaI/MecI/CopY family transcriptional regulator [Draconibacterium halophilum]QIA07902.1 BlaI/MecI/CopY family transcriptional regulator [Draconibacterium halophilum]